MSAPFTVRGFHPLPGLGDYVWLGAIPILRLSRLAGSCGKAGGDDAVTAYALGAVLFLAVVAAFPTVAMNDYKVPTLLRRGGRAASRRTRTSASGPVGWLRHSMVFYVRREVKRIDDPEDVDEFLALPRPAYVLVPDDVWEMRLDQS